jgi:hypothetical protein
VVGRFHWVKLHRAYVERPGCWPGLGGHLARGDLVRVFCRDWGVVYLHGKHVLSWLPANRNAEVKPYL